MKNEQISFYNEFSCIGGECKQTCCKGWNISVDENSYQKYMKLPFPDRFRLFMSIHTKDDYKLLNKYSNGCNLHTKDGLCLLQKKYGLDMLCDVCRIFPRIQYKFTPGALRFLDLSCPEVSKLLLSHMDRISLSPTDDRIEISPYGDNDDYEYYSFLHSLLNLITDVIDNTDYTLGHINSMLIIIGNLLKSEFVHLSDSADIYDQILKKVSDLITETTPDEYYIDSVSIDKMITGGFYHTKLKKRSPMLYKLCRLYFKAYDKMTIEDVDTLFKHLPQTTQVSEELDYTMNEVIRAYLKYNILYTFMELFEDYSFEKKLCIPIIKASLLSMFIWLYSHYTKPIDSENLPLIISAVHRRGSGNDSLFEDFFYYIYSLSS